MSSRRGNLQPAHRGYLYQDIATAYMLVRAVVDRYEEVIVDRKQVDDDRIDDLEVKASGKRVRRQFKSSQDERRSITEADFTAASSTLRIDRLVLTHVRAGSSAADEYRLCATWQPPESGDPLLDMLEPVNADPTIENWSSKFYRLRGEVVWPAGATPVWAPLAAYAQPGVEFGRNDVIAFCERFIIELSLPQASTVLTEPGPLERALIEELSERVGIGRYPNQSRVPADVAALSIRLANLARTKEASLTPADVERELEIRTDFGRVAQAFPLDESLFHDRPVFRRTVREAALTGMHQLIVAPPGAGKSWELTRLAGELSEAGAIVARHYCYLEPGDEMVERRVTTDVFFGNLLGELIDAAPDLLGAGEARYAAGLSELEATLAKAATFGRPVVLVVDGLDHIARVRADARSLAEDETDIVEQLATVNIPAGVAIIIGSQPGHHLDPIRGRWGATITERQLPRWLPADLVALVRQHGVDGALAAVGIREDDDVQRLHLTLADQADGSPLYARYLARGLISGLQDGTITNPHDWISDAPMIGGDIAVYYAHLYQTASVQTQVIADLFGVIDFAVTESDLREMLPAVMGAWVPRALALLTPVLSSAAAQGGVRVFHESFRRFMTEELARDGRSIADALAPVITWLDRRGFYRDAKSYRFLLPALRRAGRSAEIFERVNVTFVSESVAQAHPIEAIQRNLALTADVAARLRDWPTLVRCVELHRSAYTCFDESQNTWHDYWTAYLELFGPAALSERLLFDGRPTQDRGDGLLACSMVDDAGWPAPWRDYLDLRGETDSESHDTFDKNGGLTTSEFVSLAAVHGRLRLGEHMRIVRRLCTYLNRCGNTFKPLFVRRLAARIARMASPSLVERLACRSDPARPAGQRMTPRAAAVLRLGIADEYARLSKRAEAVAAATLALNGADTAELAVECLAHGAPANLTFDIAVDPATVSIGVGAGEYLHDSSGVRSWVASIRILARDSINGLQILDRERQRIAGQGWYRSWLRFVIEVAGVESARAAGHMGDIVAAFRELTRDVHPFLGNPRPCDLYAIRRVIRETIAWGLSLLRSEDEWNNALEFLSIASKGTGSRLDREDGGPLPTGALLEVLMPYAADSIGGDLVRHVIEQQVQRRDQIGTYYPTHAEYAMTLARVRYASGDSSLAYEAWKRAAVYLAGYSWHKDVTVFEIIESAPALLKVSQQVALQALADVQPLANAVITHTDGRETKHAPNAWLAALVEVHPEAGIELLARTMTEDDGTGGWPNIEAIHDITRRVRDTADPALVDAVLSTLLFEIEYENRSAETADERLASLIRLNAVDHDLVTRTIRRIAAEVSGDARRYTDGAAARVEAIASELGVPVPRISRTNAGTIQPHSPVTSPRRLDYEIQVTGARFPPFTANPTFVDLLAGLRAAGRTRHWDDSEAWDGLILALSYHLTCLVDDGRVDDARRLLRFFARDTDVGLTSMAHPLAKLATALEVAGYSHIASVAYALAYTATRGGHGFLRFGDEIHAHLITQGMALDREATRQVVADEVAYGLRGSWHTMGISRHLVERIADWGEPDIAERAWRETFKVIAHRLPLTPNSGWFAPLEVNNLTDWTIDEALVALLLGRLYHPVLARKIAALAGLVRAMRRRPDAVVKPLHWWLKSNSSVTSLILVLDALWSTEAEPFAVTQALEEILVGFARGEMWGPRRLAARLLARAGRGAALTSIVATPIRQLNGESVLTPDLRAALLSVDRRGVLDQLEPMWPELSELVLCRLHRMFDSAENKERAMERYRLSRGLDGKSFPPTPVLLWESELFETTLHQELTDLNAHLWATAQWTPEIEDSLLGFVLPTTALHLGLAASRSPRPAWPQPATLSDGLGVLPVLADDDPEFAGWTRLATVERQYVTDPARPYGGPTEVVTLFAGVVAMPLGSTISPEAFPFKSGDVNDWWLLETPPARFPPGLPLGPLLRLTRHRDWLGDAFVLVPPIALRSYIELEPSRYGEPLTWSDSTGAPAIALRTWRIRNAHAIDAEPVEYEGSDLIARPDAVRRLNQLVSVPLREARVVWRRSISENGPTD